MPSNYDSMDSNNSKTSKEEKGKSTGVSRLNAFMIERMKKNSILNHKVFMREGINYKKRVNDNLQKMQRAITMTGGMAQHETEYNFHANFKQSKTALI